MDHHPGGRKYLKKKEEKEAFTKVNATVLGTVQLDITAGSSCWRFCIEAEETAASRAMTKDPTASIVDRRVSRRSAKRYFLGGNRLMPFVQRSTFYILQQNVKLLITKHCVSETAGIKSSEYGMPNIQYYIVARPNRSNLSNHTLDQQETAFRHGSDGQPHGPHFGSFQRRQTIRWPNMPWRTPAVTVTENAMIKY